jgi:hypothetical protein
MHGTPHVVSDVSRDHGPRISSLRANPAVTPAPCT